MTDVCLHWSCEDTEKFRHKEHKVITAETLSTIQTFPFSQMHILNCCCNTKKKKKGVYSLVIILILLVIFPVHMIGKIKLMQGCQDFFNQHKLHIISSITKINGRNVLLFLKRLRKISTQMTLFFCKNILNIRTVISLWSEYKWLNSSEYATLYTYILCKMCISSHDASMHFCTALMTKLFIRQRSIHTRRQT